ncbi:MAG: tetratricopeptide repeat protein [Phycisphaeraceae bacterium]
MFMRTRMGALALMLAAVFAVGCRAGASDRDAASAKTVAGPVAPPEPLESESLTPLSGAALERAELELDAVLDRLPRPVWLADREPVAGGGEDALPVAAQRAYAAGRQALLEERNYQAVQRFEQALKLSPKHPGLLRLLGRIYSASGNRSRGADYLRRAVLAGGGDVRSFFLLGRHAIEQQQWGEAASLLGRALRRSADEPDLTAQVRHHLAEALARLGYARAAAEQYRASLREQETLRARLRGEPEVRLLDRQAGLSRMAVGDLHHQLGEPEQALAAYERAADETSPGELAPRLAYTWLKLNRPGEAERIVLEQAEASPGERASLDLVRYLARHVESDQLMSRLRAVYVAEGRPTAMAMMLADLHDPAGAADLLREHLTERPEAQAVYARLLSQWLPRGAAEAEPQAVRQAIRVAADLMRAAPELADQYATTLLRAAGAGPALASAFSGLGPEERDQPTLRVLRGLALAGQDRVDEAKATLESVLEEQPGLAVARVVLARLYLLEQAYEQANEVLEPLPADGAGSVLALRVRVLVETGRTGEAIQMLDRLIDRRDGEVELMLQKAGLQQRAGDAKAAEQTLLDALSQHPEAESVYQALINLYEGPGGASLNAREGWARVVRRLLETIPNSRVGRLVQARLAIREDRWQRAEQLLSGLLEEDRLDLDALRLLFSVYREQGEPGRIRQRMNQLLADQPTNVEVLQLAESVYGRLGDVEQLIAVGERLMEMLPPTPDRQQWLATLYLRNDQPGKAAELLGRLFEQEQLEDPAAPAQLMLMALVRQGRGEAARERIGQAIDRYSEHDAELRYLQANLANWLGDVGRYAELLERNLERHPEHVATLNDLAYLRARLGRKLDAALELANQVLDAEPGVPAYQDTKGWVLYRQGRFEEAIKWLQRARSGSGPDSESPVVLDHVGDALYRLGEPGRAEALWRRAKMLAEDSADDWWIDEELEGLSARIDAKLDALAADEEVPVAPVADEASDAQP